MEPGMLVFIDENHASAPFCEQRCDRGTARAAANHEHVAIEH